MKTKLLLNSSIVGLILILFNSNLFSQQINVGRSKWYVCIQPAGSTCGSVPCLSNHEESERKDPCVLYDYWYYGGDPPVKTKGVCCSVKGMMNPNSPEKGIRPFQGQNFFIAADTLFLMAQCVIDDDTTSVFIANLNIGDVANWEAVVSFTYSPITDSLFVDLYQKDSFFPFYKPATKVTFKFGPEIAEGLCSGVPNTQTGIKYFRTAKVSTEFYPNPVISGELNYSMVNEEALLDNIIYKFYNSLGELIYEYKPTEAEGIIDISKLPPGIIFIHCASDKNQEVKSIYIYR